MTRSKNGYDLGRISVQFEVANYGDLVGVERRILTPDKVRRTIITGVVDTGASRLVLPEAVGKLLGLTKTDKVRVRYADGRSAKRDAVQGVHVQLLGRGGVFTAILENNREDALIGAIVLEDLDLIVDCRSNVLKPRDPDIVVNEIG